jgi:hypothetical protein
MPYQESKFKKTTIKIINVVSVMLIGISLAKYIDFLSFIQKGILIGCHVAFCSCCVSCFESTGDVWWVVRYVCC